MEPEGFLPCSQEPKTGPYLEPDKSRPHPHTLDLSYILITSSYLRLCFSSDLFPLGFLTKFSHAFLISPISNPEDGDNMFLRNVGIYLQVHTTLQTRRPTLKNYTLGSSRVNRVFN
jgi:hypothetical protein